VELAIGEVGYSVLIGGAPTHRASIVAGATLPAEVIALAPAILDLSVSHQEQAFEGASVEALPAASHLGIGGSAVAGTSAADGSLQLAVTPAESLQLKVRSSLANVLEDVMSPAAGQQLRVTIDLRAPLSISGRITGEDVSVPGVMVALYCETCTPFADDPEVQTITDAAGRFVLHVADPGVAP
jgi:hypothetical protein